MTQNQTTSNCMETKLKANPFNAYRDPKTGEWRIVNPQTPAKNQANGSKS